MYGKFFVEYRGKEAVICGVQQTVTDEDQLIVR